MTILQNVEHTADKAAAAQSNFEKIDAFMVSLTTAEGASFRFKDGQFQIRDSADEQWRAFGSTNGQTGLSAPIA